MTEGLACFCSVESVELRDPITLFNIEQIKRGAKGVRYLSRKKMPGVPRTSKPATSTSGLERQGDCLVRVLLHLLTWK